MPSQNVSLTSDLMGYVSSLVNEGQYASVSEVHREAIRDFREKKEKERLYRERVNQLLEEGERDLAEGRYITISSEEEQRAFFQNIEDEVTQELTAEHASR